MSSLGINVIGLSIFVFIQQSFSQKLFLDATPYSTDQEEVNIYHQLLSDIHYERSFDTILLLQQDLQPIDARLEDIYKFPKPKLFLTSNSYGFNYKVKYNSEILLLLIMSNTVNLEMIQTAARTLNFMRQVRSVIIALDVADSEDFQETLLNLCRVNKMTNVLLHFLNYQKDLNWRYYQLNPYPIYQWKEVSLKEHNVGIFFPQHWRNMQQGSLVTYTDQMVPSTLLYEDVRGNLKLSGYVARLVLLFAELFNATLKMYKPLRVGEVSHFTLVNQLVADNLVDIPMTLDISDSHSPTWIHRSAVYEISQGMLIVPCAQPMTNAEVFGLLFDLYFLGSVLICTVLFSLMIGLIDYIFHGRMPFYNLVFNVRVFPGVLGQSFVAGPAAGHSLNLVYILLFFAGLNISTQFSANMNTRFTSPPLHRQIKTLADIKMSPLKIHVLQGDSLLMGGTLLPIFRSVFYSDNISEYEKQLNNFNTSTGYFTTSTNWQMLGLKQQYFLRKAFCTYDNMTIFRILPWTFLLQQHSPYKEPLDYLIHRVHELGLINAWHSSTFTDLLKLKKMSTIQDSTPKLVAIAMTVNDLHWAWMVVVIGLGISGVILLAELKYHQCTEFSD